MKQLVNRVEDEYGFTVRSHQVIRNSNKSLLVLFDTPHGKWIGKRMFISRERQNFILQAQEYLQQRHIAIPETKRTLTHARFMEWQGYPFVIQKKAPGKLHSLATRKGVKLAASCLGKIHAASVGFECQTSHSYNGANAWENEYETDLLSLHNWRLAHAAARQKKLKLIVEAIPFFYSAGRTAQEHARQSAYFAHWKKLPPRQHFLCHGDFHPGNLLVKNRKLVVIDWEDVRYDFPSKDIARLLSSAMRRQKKWSTKTFTSLLQSYLRHNPLTAEQLRLLYQDLAFPHIVERFLRRNEYKAMSVDGVKQFLLREKQKTRYMLKQLKAHA